MGFPGYGDQSVLSFLKGRSSRFLQFFAVSIMSRQEIFLVFVLVLTIMVFFSAGNKGALDFLVF